MTSSTESKLKSKYETSSKKIQELYEEFSLMRRNICTPSKKVKLEDVFGDDQPVYPDLSSNLNQLNIPKVPRSCNPLNKQQPLPSFSLQTQKILKNAVLKNVTTGFMQLDKKMDEKVLLMEKRLTHLNDLFKQLSKLYKLKQTNLKQSAQFFKPKCQCSQLEKLLAEVEAKYNTKIANLVATYENKISLLMKQHHQTSTASNSKNVRKQITEQMQKVEDKLIVKQQEITNIKIQCSRLRKALDQHKQLLSEKESLVEELTNQVSGQQKKISELEDEQKNRKILVNQSQQNQRLKKEIAELKESFNNEKAKLETTIQNYQTTKDIQKSEIKNDINKSQWDFSEIQKGEICQSDYEEEEGENVIKIDIVEDEMPLRHTQYFNSNARKNTFQQQRKIKQLQAQLQLLQEQNMLLKTKKDKFEQQCKDNEGDEQKFQMQSQILRDQLKNLNVSLKCLDECAILCLKEKKVPEETVDKLSDLVKFKEEFFKKFPRKKQKSVKL